MQLKQLFLTLVRKMITITSKALDKINKIEKPEDFFLRISILGGGCSGFQYSFTLEELAKDDVILEDCLLVDPMSSMYLDEAILDYEESLTGSIFTITNPQAKTSCGCGESFSV
jgi:iron-sulfur cluster insertion protein